MPNREYYEKRMLDIVARRLGGETWRSIAKSYDLSPERPPQIYAQWKAREELKANWPFDERYKYTDERIRAVMKYKEVTLEELAKFTNRDLLATPNFGRKSVRRLRDLTHTTDPDPHPYTPKYPKWAIEEHSAADKIRQAAGVEKYGDGFALLRQFKECNNEMLREFAAVLERSARASFMSMDRFDALCALYLNSPWLGNLLKIAETEKKPVLKVVGGTDADR